MLIEAQRHSRTALVKVLVKTKADINISNSSGNTAVHLAATQGDVDTMEFLIDRADPPFDEEMPNKFGFTAQNLLKMFRNSQGSAAVRIFLW